MTRAALPLVLALLLLAGLVVALDPLGWLGGSESLPAADETESVLHPAADADTVGLAVSDLLGTSFPEGEMDLGLGGGALSGSVVDEEGRPVPGALVSLREDPRGPRGVRTRSDGSFLLQGLPLTPILLTVTADGFQPHTEPGPPLAEADVVPMPAITLRRLRDHRAQIDVLVTDLLGRPLHGARVLASTLPWDLQLIFGPEKAGARETRASQGRTDEEGWAHLRTVVPDLYNVMAHRAGFVATSKDRVLVRAGDRRRVVIRLPEAVSISGKVVGPENLPVAAAMVFGLHQPSFATCMPTQTDAEGRFVLDSLRPGTYLLVAGHDEEGVGRSTGRAPGTDATVRLGGTGALKGRVVDANGRPLPDAVVRPFRAGPFEYVYSQVYEVGTSGGFDLLLPPGAYLLRARLPDGRVSKDTPATVGSPEDVTLVIPEDRIVRGLVVDARGDHVSGAEIYVRMGGFPPTPNREQYARSDSEGRFVLHGLADEPIRLHALHPDHAPTTFEADPAPAESAAEVLVRLPSGGAIVGHVRDDEGNGIALEQVNTFAGGNFFDAQTTFTDESGAYAFRNLASGTYTVTTGPFEQGARGLSSGGIQISDEGTATVNFTSPRADGVVEGSVLMGGAPVSGARVRVLDFRGPEGARTTQTNEEGRFRVDGVALGSVLVEATATDGTSGQERVTVPSGAPATVAVTLGTAGLRFRLVDSDGQGVGGAFCGLSTPGGGWEQLPTSGGDGRVVRSGLSAGAYVLRVSHDDFAQYASPTLAIPPAGMLDLGDIQLSPSATIHGRVTDDAGRPVENATVSVRTIDGRTVFGWSMSTTGSDGRYVLQGVEPGQYRVRFEARGLAPDETLVDLAAGGTVADGVLTRGGAIVFRVEETGGRPVEGAAITVYDAQGLPVRKTLSLANLSDQGSRRSNAEGSARLDDLAAGRYRVEAVHENFLPAEEGVFVQVQPGGEVLARLVLERRGDR